MTSRLPVLPFCAKKEWESECSFLLLFGRACVKKQEDLQPRRQGDQGSRQILDTREDDDGQPQGHGLQGDHGGLQTAPLGARAPNDLRRSDFFGTRTEKKEEEEEMTLSSLPLLFFFSL